MPIKKRFLLIFSLFFFYVWYDEIEYNLYLRHYIDVRQCYFKRKLEEEGFRHHPRLPADNFLMGWIVLSIQTPHVPPFFSPLNKHNYVRCCCWIWRTRTGKLANKKKKMRVSLLFSRGIWSAWQMKREDNTTREGGVTMVTEHLHPQ